jgi:capsular polysaccharide export protein
LQGPQSRFFERIARELIAHGHRATRINLNFGDRLVWRLPAIDFRGRLADWPGFVTRVIAERAVSDVLLLGAQRPYHLAAAQVARESGARVFITDLGLLRPGWLTLAASDWRMPRDPAAIRALAARFPEPDLAPGFAAPFRLLAAHDIAYHVPSVLGRALYPHYRRHNLHHPFAEYAAWVGNAPRRLAAKRRVAAAKARFAAEPGSYFIYPLQLAGDFQLRAHSPFAGGQKALAAVLCSFREHGGERRLVIAGHPLDEGLIDWRRLVRGEERTVFLEGGVTGALVAGAAGVVTVNSTVGLAALRAGVPVKALGEAVYDVPGLSHAGNLAGFWRAPLPPDRELLAAFLRALVGATQIKGGYYGRAAQAQALPGFVERLLD